MTLAFDPTAAARSEIGLMVEGQEGMTWPEWLDLACLADELGFASLYRSDHYLSEQHPTRRGGLDAWGAICRVAPLTKTIRLGTLVSPVTFRHPAVLAKLVVTADHLSDGRIDVGLGTGWYAAEHAAYGFAFPPAPVRFAVLAEQLEIIRRSWTTGAFSLNGDHYQVRELDALPKPRRPPRLILGGSGSPRGVQLAARWADEYNSPISHLELVDPLRSKLDRACNEIGRDPATLPLSVLMPIASDRIPAGGGSVQAEEAIERVGTLRAAGAERVVVHLGSPDLDVVDALAREWRRSAFRLTGEEGAVG